MKGRFLFLRDIFASLYFIKTCFFKFFTYSLLFFFLFYVSDRYLFLFLFLCLTKRLLILVKILFLFDCQIIRTGPYSLHLFQIGILFFIDAAIQDPIAFFCSAYF